MIHIVHPVEGRPWEVSPLGYPPLVVVDEKVRVGAFTRACEVPTRPLSEFGRQKAGYERMARALTHEGGHNIILVVTPRAVQLAKHFLVGDTQNGKLKVHLAACKGRPPYTITIDNGELYAFVSN